MLGRLQLNCTQRKRLTLSLSEEAGGQLLKPAMLDLVPLQPRPRRGRPLGRGCPRVIIIDAPTHGPLYRHVGCHRPMVGRVRRVNTVPTGRGWPLQLCPSQIIPCQSPPPRPQAHTQRRHRVTSDLEEEEEGDEVEVGVGGGDGGLHGAVGRLPAHLPGQCRVAHKAALYCQLWPLWAVNQR